MKTKKIHVGELTIHTETFGDPSAIPCLLIAGAMASARLWTDRFCQLLVEKGFFVIRYDHRDIGESSGVDWQKARYTLSDLGKDAIGILDACDIKRAHIVGHSMGGYVSQRVAIEFPERVLTMTIISAGPIGATIETDLPLTAEEKATLDQTWKVLLGRRDGPSLEATIQNFLPVWQYLNGRFPLDIEMTKTYTRDLLTRSHHSIRMGSNHELLMQNLEIEKYRDILQKISVPTLIIHGEDDNLALPRNARALAHAIPNNNLIMIPKMGHMFFDPELETKIVELCLNYSLIPSRK